MATKMNTAIDDGRAMWLAPRATVRRLMLIGAPLALAMLAVWHPVIDGTDKLALMGNQATWWTLLHIVQLPLAALVGLSVVRLLDGLRGRTIMVTRIAMAIFVVFFSAFDALPGIANGIILHTHAGIAHEHNPAINAIITAMFESPIARGVGAVAAVAFWTGIGAAAMTLRRTGVARSSLMLLVAGGLMFGLTHVPPIGPLGLLLLAIGTARIEMALRRSPRG